MTHAQRSILWICPPDPWSVWTLSGITREICVRLRDRGLLHGALSAQDVNERTMLGATRLDQLLSSVRRRLKVKAGEWSDEEQGPLGRILKRLPEGAPVMYQFVAPQPSPALKLRRFRLMDLSLADAIRTGAYGHSELSQQQYDEKFEQQKQMTLGCEGIVTLSTYAADSISRELDYPRSRITAIGSGSTMAATSAPVCDEARYAKARILFVGRDWERKGGDTLLEAFRIVRQRLPHATLTVIGPAKPPTQEAGVEYVPPINKGTPSGQRRLQQAFADASVFCMPSLCETWGLVYIEANQLGAPIVGFREWALPDIVEDGRSGVLVDERSAEALAEALIEALREPARLRQMALAAVHRVTDVLDWPHVVDRLLSRVLPEALSGREPVRLQGDEQFVGAVTHERG